jgi:hypothetical protein
MLIVYVSQSFAAMLAASDYILAAVLTACAGKYYSMLRTLKPNSDSQHMFSHNIPLSSRVKDFTSAMPPLFTVGVFSATVGYR